MKKIALVVIMAMAIAGLTASCGGGGGGASGLNGAQSVTGYVHAPNSDPVPGTTAYIPTASANLTKKFPRTKNLKATAPDGTTCTDPAATSCAVTCSNADGTYTMDTSACTGTETQMIVQKGAWQKTIDLNCTADPCETNITFGGGDTVWPKVAVVTGESSTYDRMQDVLAKLAPDAYGTPNASGQLQFGSENTTNLTFIDGNNTLGGAYTTFDTYLNGTNSLSGFDIVFINCMYSPYDTLLSDPAVKAVLENYVTNGGKLYVTDLSYDFINQVWPSFLPFHGNINNTTPGDLGDAEIGTPGLTLNAAISSTEMSGWLQNVTVNADSETEIHAPKSGQCSYAITRTGALNADGTIPIGDFLVGWAHIDNTYATSATLWISSGASAPAFDGLVNRPLTASQSIGSSGGMLFYSSYHTADECPTTGFWPQERILQYLIFEAF